MKALPQDIPESVKLAAVQQSQYSGPLPPPALYQEFDKVLPGSAERILTMAEKEQNHRHEWERVALNAHNTETKWGQWLGFIVAMSMVIGAVY